MHDKLLKNQDALSPRDLLRYAEELELDLDRFHTDLKRHEYADRITEDVASADASGVAGTPSFFINGKRHHGAYDVATLTSAVHAARGRAVALSAASA
jgi:protein-disulfide isomerase